MGNSPSSTSEAHSETSDWGLEYQNLTQPGETITIQQIETNQDVTEEEDPSVTKHDGSVDLKRSSSPPSTHTPSEDTTFLSSGKDHIGSPSTVGTPRRKPRPMRFLLLEDVTPKRTNVATLKNRHDRINNNNTDCILQTQGTAFSPPPTVAKPGRVSPDEVQVEPPHHKTSPFKKRILQRSTTDDSIDSCRNKNESSLTTTQQGEATSSVLNARKDGTHDLADEDERSDSTLLPAATKQVELPKKNPFLFKKPKLYHLKFLPALKALESQKRRSETTAKETVSKVLTSTMLPDMLPPVETLSVTDGACGDCSSLANRCFDVRRGNGWADDLKLPLVPKKSDLTKVPIQQVSDTKEPIADPMEVYIGDTPSETANSPCPGNHHLLELCYKVRSEYWSAFHTSSDRGADVLQQLISKLRDNRRARFVRATTFETMELHEVVDALEALMNELPLPDDVVFLPAPTERFPNGLVTAPDLFFTLLSDFSATNGVHWTNPSIIRDIRSIKSYTSIRFLLAIPDDNLLFKEVSETDRILLQWYCCIATETVTRVANDDS